MMKIVVVSDTHGNSVSLSKIINDESPFNFLFHCGDGIDDIERVNIKPDIRVLGVSGNMDAYSSSRFASHAVSDIDGRRFLILHGNIERAHDDLLGVLMAGRERGADIVVFGHTHRPFLSDADRPILFNPGPALNGQYGIITIDENAMNFAHKRVGG